MVRVVALLTFLFSFPTLAARPPVGTDCLAHAADEIVVARFLGSKSDAIYADKYGDLYLGKFARLGSFKGFDSGQGGGEFELLWRKGVSEQPAFKVNAVYLIYLSQSDIGSYVLYGSRGAREIKGSTLPEIRSLREALKKKRPPHCDEMRGG